MTNELTSILKAEGLEHLIPTLVDQGIVDSMLADLTESDLKTIGIDKLGERKRLLTVFAESKSAKPAIWAPSGLMVRVEGGILPAGSPQAGTMVEPFLIGQYAVTNQEWQSVRSWGNANGYEIDLPELGGGATFAKSYPKHPVVSINWYDCVKWCNAKSEMEGLEPVYGLEGEEGVFCTGEFVDNRSSVIAWDENANGYRLPKIAEWEWAARGGNNSKGYSFAGANNLNEVGWYESNSEGQVKEVGLKTPNELGLFDMSGNVQERCWEIDLGDTDEAITHWVRGGSYLTPEEDCKVSEIIWTCKPGQSGKDLGFRIARRL